MSTLLSEVYIQDCFHSYLRSSLAQAKAERLLDIDVLASAEADLMITGPALCLYFAAIRSTTIPPSVPLPRLDKTQPPAQLSTSNCPPTYIPFLRLWSETVDPIQSLAPEAQHDLARLICGLPGLLDPQPQQLARLAADLRAVAIEISQRRTFQERYESDLQAAIDAGSGSAAASSTNGEGSSGFRGRRYASFKPPPSYDEVSNNSESRSPSPNPSVSHPHPTLSTLPENGIQRVEPLHIRPRTPTSPTSPYTFAPDPSSPSFPVPQHIPPSPSLSSTPDLPPRPAESNGHRRHSRDNSATSSAGSHAALQSPGLLSPSWSVQQDKPLPAPPPGPSYHAPAAVHKRTQSASSTGSIPPSPTLIPADAPAISLIRETLYASLADVLATHPSLREQARSPTGDKARSYFGAVALAILNVATTRMTPSGGVLGVLGAELTEAACPVPLRPLMREFANIGHAFKGWEEEDSMRTVEALSEGREPPQPGAERVKLILEHGVGHVESGMGDGERPRSPEGRALALANRINVLALKMIQLKPFRERQEEVFKVLVGVSD